MLPENPTIDQVREFFANDKFAMPDGSVEIKAILDQNTPLQNSSHLKQ